MGWVVIGYFKRKLRRSNCAAEVETVERAGMDCWESAPAMPPWAAKALVSPRAVA
jgi:hypothetical protein